MRALNVVLGVVMLAFAGVQYNDPDALLWVAYYAIPAACAFAVAWRAQDFAAGAARALLAACVAATALLMLYHWPAMPGFWRSEVWLNEETAREGMGLMIAFAVTVVAFASAARAPRRAS